MENTNNCQNLSNATSNFMKWMSIKQISVLYKYKKKQKESLPDASSIRKLNLFHKHIHKERDNTLTGFIGTLKIKYP